MEDNLDDVGQQLDLLTETQDAVVSNPVGFNDWNKNIQLERTLFFFKGISLFESNV